MAIGLALLFGFRLPINFDDPLKTSSIIDFWQKWHITMSRFFRIYIFFPVAFKLESNYNFSNPINNFILTFLTPITLTFFLTGLWHGANWNFVIFGLIHAFYITINQINKIFLKIELNKFLSTTIVFFFFSLSLIYFRSEDLFVANYLVLKLFSFDFGENNLINTNYFYSIKFIFFLLFAYYMTYFVTNYSKYQKKIIFNYKKILITFFMLVISVFTLTEERPFIYFQF